MPMNKRQKQLKIEVMWWKLSKFPFGSMSCDFSEEGSKESNINAVLYHLMAVI